MGRYRAERVVVKELPELTLVFWDNSSIYLFPKTGQAPVVFHKWFAPRYTYTNGWRQFRDMLWHLRRGSVEGCFRAAYDHGVLYQVVVGRLNFNKKPVEVRYPTWSIKGVANELYRRL